MSSVRTPRGLFVCVGVCGVIVVGLVCVVKSDSQDLYRVLEVSRSASQKEIKDAYKRQAMLWHPDKNRSPQAKDKLIEINGAYEVLKDPDKRHTYDMTGRVGDSPQHAAHSSGQGFTFFQGGNMFRFQFPGGPTHRSDDIITQQFFNNILPDSHHKPYLLNFYTDFCVLCANVGNIWKVLHKDLAPLGVGLGSVHANLHPRVTQYCGVSHVPSIVGVVSGRVVRYYGQLRDKSTMNQFLEDILPSSVVTSVTKANMDSFLSKVITANKPRVVLFSPRAHPSLLYKLTAFTHQKMVDFGFVSTHAHWTSAEVLDRFEVGTGEKLLAVFKENYKPVKVVKGTVNQAVLQSTVEGLTLLLPRLSSQLMFNTVCPATASNRFCVILTLPGPSAYNDSMTAVFRRMTTDKASTGNRFAYIDGAKQSDFLAAFQPSPIASRVCQSGVSARPVLVLRRSSNLFDWFDQFCGEDGDLDRLYTFLSALRSSTKQMKHVTMTSPLFDEDAPGWFGHTWNKVVEFFSDFYDFLTAIDSNISTLLATVIFPLLMICMLLIFTGNQQQEEDDRRSSPRADNHNGRHSSSSIPRSSHKQRRSSPSHHHSSPHTHQTQLYTIDRDAYNAFVQDSARGQIALVILINTHHHTETEILLKSFWSLASMYSHQRLKLCYLCYKTHSNWLESILSRCEEMNSNEVGLRTSGCLSGHEATIIALLGSKRQFCIFPEVVSINHNQDELESVNEIGADVIRSAVTESSNHHKYDSKQDEQIVVNSSSDLSIKAVDTNPSVLQDQSEPQSVGDVLGSVLGFTDDSDIESESKQVEAIGPRYEVHRTGNGLTNTNNTIQTNIGNGSLYKSKVDSGSVTTSRAHKNGSVGNRRHLDPRVEQISSKFGMWMERFADGSLKRYTVDGWPDWRT